MFTVNTELTGAQWRVVEYEEAGQHYLRIIINENEYATGYRFIVGGTQIDHDVDDLNANEYVYRMEMEDYSYKVSVQYLGDTFADNGNYYLDSNPSAQQSFHWN